LSIRKLLSAVECSEAAQNEKRDRQAGSRQRSAILIMSMKEGEIRRSPVRRSLAHKLFGIMLGPVRVPRPSKDMQGAALDAIAVRVVRLGSPTQRLSLAAGALV